MFFHPPTRVLLVLVLFHLPQIYWAWRGARALDGRHRWLFIVAVAALQAPWSAFLFGFTGTVALLPEPLQAPYRILSALWVMASLSLFLAVAALRLTTAILRRVPAFARTAAPEGHDPERRKLLQLGTSSLGLVPCIAVGYGLKTARVDYRIEERTVAIPDLPPAFEALRIVQLTDIHVSDDMPPDLIEKYVELASELDPDLGMLTGDFLAFDQRGLEECVDALSRLRTRSGVYGCLGNHEIHTEASDRITSAFERRGVDILRDEARDFETGGSRLRIVGVDYQRSKRAPLWHIRKLVSASEPNLLLSHNPNVFPHAAELGFDLTLSGHTHGGQVRIEILEKELSPSLFMSPYVQGLYRRNASQLYVSRGIGTTGLPIRLGATPEITLLRLRRAT